MPKLNSRAMMEKAIEVMRQSISELRTDGKASPFVGAVLVDLADDPPRTGRIETAFRGELREGDHAEFTLLERKCRNRRLDHCVLFATLEPCAPKSRNFPKLGCAERIVLARIKKVWVGIEDPDPKVDREGIKFLRDNGVEVEMFDRDLQDVIRDVNRDFLEQATERAADQEKNKIRNVILSPLELAAQNSQLEDLDTAALESYRSHAKFVEAVGSTEFRRRLIRQGLLELAGERFVPTGFGMLLFGREPRTLMPQAGLLATIHFADGNEEIRDFDGPQVFVPEDVINWLKDKLPNVIDRSHGARKETNQTLFELIREAVVNALVHRDYDVHGAKCQLIVSSDKIVIRSPGQPVYPITLEKMQSLDSPMLSRNPVLHFVFAKMGLAEERGLGLKSMKQKSISAGLPLPKFSEDDPYLDFTIFPTSRSAADSLPGEVLAELSESEVAGWKWLTTKGHANTPEYSSAIGADVRTGRRHLQHFVEFGLVRVIGAGRATKYQVI